MLNSSWPNRLAWLAVIAVAAGCSESATKVRPRDASIGGFDSAIGKTDSSLFDAQLVDQTTDQTIVDGQVVPDATRRPDSRLAGVCGNEKREAGEGCDDGNLDSGDGCDASCNVERGWSCSLGPAWIFPHPTPENTAGQPAAGWVWSPTSATANDFARTYETDESTCVGGYLHSTHWISVDPSGCGAIGSSGPRYFRTDFQVTAGQLAQGPIRLNLGWDNFLTEVTLNGNTYNIGGAGQQDGWPAPRHHIWLSQAHGLVAGNNVLVLEVDEVGSAGSRNNTGVHVSQSSADSCVQNSTPAPDGGLADAAPLPKKTPATK